MTTTDHPAPKTNLALSVVPSGLLDHFLADLDVSEASKLTYRRALRQFFVWLTAAKPATLDRTTILAFKANLRERRLSSLTINNVMAAVRIFFAWAESEGLHANVAASVKGERRGAGFNKDALTAAQARELLTSINCGSVAGLRDFAIVNLLLRTGLRTIEVIRADVGDVRQQSGVPVLRIQGKGRADKSDVVVLTDAALRPIYAYLAARGAVADDAALFASHSDRNDGQRMTTRSISRVVKEHLRSIGLDSRRLSAHSLRHTAITFALQGGATVQEAQALARHASLSTTMIYAHAADRVANAAERKIDVVIGEV